MTDQDQALQTVAYVVLRPPEGEDVSIRESFGAGYPIESAMFMWTEGNYGCDCNKRRCIWRAAGVSQDEIEARENPCGHTIKLVSLTITQEP